VRRYIGDGIQRLAKRLLTGQMNGDPPADGFERALDLFERHYRDTLTQRTRPSLGSRTDFASSRERPQLACVTNKAESFTLPLLEATGLRGFFDLVVAGDTLPRKTGSSAAAVLRTAVRRAAP
jgi:phosphoglycolate phosphatase